MGGVLQFDGKDDIVYASPVPDLDREVFGVFVWIKGGARDQVVLSPSGGAKWLYTNPIDGSLATELRSPGGSAVPFSRRA